MKVAVKRLFPDVRLPEYQTGESAGFDLRAHEDVTIAPGGISLVRTGLVIEAPPGYFLALFVRSSLPLKQRLTLGNGVGVVDRDYSGDEDEVRIELLNVGNAPVQVRKGDRVAQGIFLPVQRVEWEETSSMRGRSRGGFGSTGQG